jgi:hypothetical protein
MHFTDDLPSKSEVFDCWKERLGELGFDIDWGEPSCWACGFHYDAKYDIKRSDVAWSEVLKRWDRIPLQRCHVIPRSLGGANDVSNLFLMCRECHDLAPNTNLAEVFLSWARGQDSIAREFGKIRTALDSFAIDVAAQENSLRLMVSEEFRMWARERASLHRPQSNYAPRSSRITPATIVGLAVEYQRAHRTT